MAVCTGAIRRLTKNAETAEEINQSLVSYFYDNFAEGEIQDFALVRLFITCPYGSLGKELKDCANQAFPKELSFPSMKCMVLQATHGQIEEWCDSKSSKGHRIIPLPSEELVMRMPMIFQLINDFGLRVSDVLAPPPDFFIGSSEEDYNIFLVPEALGSPYLPAQTTFVQAYNIKSALGFGGMLPSGNLFAMIIFSKVKISKETADMFKTIALAVNLSLMRFDNRQDPERRSKPVEEKSPKIPNRARA